MLSWAVTSPSIGWDEFHHVDGAVHAGQYTTYSNIIWSQAVALNNQCNQ